jgi:hypothetical protein
VGTRTVGGLFSKSKSLQLPTPKATAGRLKTFDIGFDKAESQIASPLNTRNDPGPNCCGEKRQSLNSEALGIGQNC